MTLQQHRENAIIKLIMITGDSSLVNIVPEFLYYYNEENQEPYFDQEMWNFIQANGSLNYTQSIEERTPVGSKSSISKRGIIDFVYQPSWLIISRNGNTDFISDVLRGSFVEVFSLSDWGDILYSSTGLHYQNVEGLPPYLEQHSKINKEWLSNLIVKKELEVQFNLFMAETFNHTQL